MTRFSEGLLEKVTALKNACFISKTTESTGFFIFFCCSHLFPHFSIFSVWIPPPVLLVSGNVALSGKLQGNAWVKLPRDVWPRSGWEQTLIHSEGAF